jgi:O-antigen/teichoic acid export membrane protein
MRRFLTSLLNHRLVRGSLTFQIGSVGAMLVQAAAGVVLARVLGPEQFGRYAIVMSLAAVGSVLLGAGAADAMAPVLSRAHHGGDDKGVRDALLFLGKFVVATACIVLILGLALPAVAHRFYGDAMLGWFALAVLAASAVSTLLFTPTQLALQVYGRIGRLSALTFADQAVRQAIVVGLALSGLGVLGASYGHLFGAFIVFAVAAFFWHRLRHGWTLVPRITELLRTFPSDGRKYIAPTLWVLADRNLAMLYGAAPVAMAGLFLSTTDVSYFKIALGWVTLALSVLTPVSILLNTELARIQVVEPGLLRSRFVRITLAAVGFSTLVTFVAALIAEPVFGLLYGPEFRAAVPLVYWFIPFGALFGLGVALGPLWRAIDKVRISIVINLIVLGIGVPLGMLALKTLGTFGAVAMVTGWYTVAHAVSFAYLIRKLKMTNV